MKPYWEEMTCLPGRTHVEHMRLRRALCSIVGHTYQPARAGSASRDGYEGRPCSRCARYEWFAKP